MSAGQIGLVRVLDVRPSRGKMRVTFVCGMRALRDARLRSKAADRAAALLSSKVEMLPEAVEAALNREREAKAALEKYRLDDAVRKADALWESAAETGGWRVAAAAVNGFGADALREMAARLAARGRTAALLESAQPEGGHLIVFARSEGEGPHMGKLLAEAVKSLGGKGGGRPEFAQGGAPMAGAALAAEAMLRSGL